MSTLDTYLTDQGITNAEFGRRCDASEATISRVRRGKQAPTMALARRIKEASGGAVTADDLMAAAPHPYPPPTLPPAASPENANQAERLG